MDYDYSKIVYLLNFLKEIFFFISNDDMRWLDSFHIGLYMFINIKSFPRTDGPKKLPTCYEN